ncbi:UTP--glucose-1-phosphate uridylyltransferase [Paroceanicella profunda]|uniref:UTP--glucose-1-phosphate uridylyltransferase n=1 Tax=Paroceanicella profunda TaxID=2579971 RepID=A0A5B8G156_9RHOB|nr:UTP--glucose-1-phosphate uridylyltransferase [Paroceanicella profunda]QDL92792.1 UTP--glucose-1-phosphate uridylyltransferase [Paroceanicella profunda]
MADMATKRIRTAVFPVAGLGTRFLPATKSTPKELLPVLDTPLIQFAMDEARAAGIDRMVFVSHPDKGSIEDYVRHDPKLCAHLRAAGKHAFADKLDTLTLNADDRAHFVMQTERLGLGHAVLQARPFVQEDAFAVILPDDLILGGPGCIGEMIEAHASCGGHLVATMEVDRERISKYGVLVPRAEQGDRLTHATGMVEKPSPEDAPSTLAVVGRYVLDSRIFDQLAVQQSGHGNEIQLTDAIAATAGAAGLAGYRFSGIRFDCGAQEGMLQATLHVANMRGMMTERRAPELALVG